jgi:hypothetical protein
MLKKRLFRFIVWIVFGWLIVVITGLILSKSLQDKVVEVLSQQAEKHIQAEIHLRKSNIHFSIFKKFPMASVELRNIVVKVPQTVNINTVKNYKADTLLFAENLFLQLNARSLLSKDYTIQKISMKNGFIQVLSDRSGNSSLNILKANDSKNTFSTNIKSLNLTHFTIYSASAKSGFNSITKVTKGDLSGTFKGSNFNLKIKSEGIIQQVNVGKEIIRPRQRYKMDVGFSSTDNLYTINKGLFQISNIPMKVVGSIRTEHGVFLDLLLSAQDVSLRQVDHSLLNDLLGQTGFQPRSGTLSLQSSIKGYASKGLPVVSSNFTISKGKVFDKKRNLILRELHLSGNAGNGNNQHLKKSFQVAIDSFSVKFGGSYQHGWLTLTNLEHPHIKCQLNGKLYLPDINSFYSQDKVELMDGSLDNVISLIGYLPKEGNKPTLSVTGTLDFHQVSVKLKKGYANPITINGGARIKNKNELFFDKLMCTSGSSDIEINGLFKNFALKGKIPEFSGNTVSNQLIIDEFTKTSEKTVPENKVYILPDSLKLIAQVKIKYFRSKNFESDNINAQIRYSNKALTINALSMEAFTGKISGNASLKQNSQNQVLFNTSASLNKLNLELMFSGFNNFSQSIISSEHLNGALSGIINFSAKWKQSGIDRESIIASGNINLTEGELKDYEPLMGLSKFIAVEELQHIQFDNLDTYISIRNKKVLLDQTHIASSAIIFDGSGVHGFDNKYEYRLQLALDDLLWKKAKRKRKDIDEFGYVVENAKDRTIIPVIISGKGSSYEVKFDKRQSRKRFNERISQEKQVMKDLFSTPETTDTIDPEPEETPVKKQEPVLEKTDSGTYRHQTNEFILDWDDSEEEDTDNQ